MIICPVLGLMNLHPTRNCVVGPRYMDPCDLSDMVLVGGAYSWVSAYVPNCTIQCFEYSKVKYVMIVLGEYICEIPPIGGKEFSHITTNRIV